MVLCAVSVLFSFGIKTEAQVSNASYEEAALREDIRVSSRIIEFLFGNKTDKGVNSGKLPKNAVLCPGGDIFGARIKEDRVTVVNSKTEKISAGDIIISINGERVHSIEDVKRIAEKSSGCELELQILRGELCEYVTLSPQLVGDEYKLGLALRDSAAGIGTVTFYSPETGAFGGLGHGICDSESGELLGMTGGVVTGVILGGVQKGAAGKPGELSGVLTNDIKGELYANTDCGVFGELERDTFDERAPIPIALRGEVREGNATIISTVKNNKRAEYSVKIYDIDETSMGTKSFKIKVTDKALLGMTGGIVRGMSGSPIIQDGKLIGAVTHVMVADPTEGYGIFIENMLEKAK